MKLSVFKTVTAQNKSHLRDLILHLSNPHKLTNKSLFISIRNAFSESTYQIIFIASQPASYKLKHSHLQKRYPFEVRLFS